MTWLLRLLGMGPGFDRWEKVNTYSDGVSWLPRAEK